MKKIRQNIQYTQIYSWICQSEFPRFSVNEECAIYILTNVIMKILLMKKRNYEKHTYL